MADTPFAVDFQSNKIIISGEGVGDELDQGAWSATKLDSGRLLLTSKESGSSADKSEGVARCSIDVLHDMLIGLNHRQWTGVVVVDTGFGQKRLFFNHGDLTFAGSTLIDDRLGEVIYREAMITLDQLTNSAVQVDRSTKFGQVLLRDQIFSNTDLWNALKNQVREIFRSVFLVSEVYIEIQQGKPPTEVTFDEGTEELIESAHSAGLQFRTFFRRLRTDSKLNVLNSDRVKQVSEGTFLADTIQLARKHASVKELLEVSKLTDINTLWVLHRMSCLGFISFSNLKEMKVATPDARYANLRHKLDKFAILADIVTKAFAANNVPYPVTELQKFAWSLNDGNLAAVYIDDTGHLGDDCIGNIMSQCQGVHSRTKYFEVRVSSLIRYVLSLAGDMLAPDANKKIRAQYAEILA